MAQGNQLLLQVVVQMIYRQRRVLESLIGKLGRAVGPVSSVRLRYVAASPRILVLALLVCQEAIIAYTY